MKAIILAAGVGSRLGNPYPKSLSILPTGESIIARQIRILRQHGIDEIYIVVGFKKEIIMEACPGVFYKYNPIYYITNTSKSLLCGIQDIDDDVLWLNGDVVFDDEVVSKIMIEEHNSIAVNNSKCGEEEVKYLADSSGFVVNISKTIGAAQGEAIGVNKVLRKDLAVLRGALNKCHDNDYFEKGMEIAIAEGLKFKTTNISEFKCIEVDFQEDWETAQGLFG